MRWGSMILIMKNMWTMKKNSIMTFQQTYIAILESVEDDIDSQKGEFHTAHGSDDRFWGNKGAGIIPYCPKTKRFLLALRSQYVNEPGTWGLLGGKIDNDENPLDAAKRELSEEINYHGKLDIKFLKLFQSGNFKFHNFLGIVEEEFSPTELDWETEKVQWFALNEFPDNLHFGIKFIISFLPH